MFATGFTDAYPTLSMYFFTFNFSLDFDCCRFLFDAKFSDVGIRQCESTSDPKLNGSAKGKATTKNKQKSEKKNKKKDK